MFNPQKNNFDNSNSNKTKLILPINKNNLQRREPNVVKKWDFIQTLPPATKKVSSLPKTDWQFTFSTARDFSPPTTQEETYIHENVMKGITDLIDTPVSQKFKKLAENCNNLANTPLWSCLNNPTFWQTLSQQLPEEPKNFTVAPAVTPTNSEASDSQSPEAENFAPMSDSAFNINLDNQLRYLEEEFQKSIQQEDPFSLSWL